MIGFFDLQMHVFSIHLTTDCGSINALDNQITKVVIIDGKKSRFVV